jgi:hypothetical protein
VPYAWSASSQPAVQPGDRVTFAAHKALGGDTYNMGFTVDFGYPDIPAEDSILDGVVALYEGLVAAGWTVDNCQQVSTTPSTRTLEQT